MIDESVVRFPIQCPMCGQESLVVDYGTTINLDPPATTQRDIAIQTNQVLTVPGLANNMHTDASAPQSTQFKTPAGRMDDQSVHLSLRLVAYYEIGTF